MARKKRSDDRQTTVLADAPEPKENGAAKAPKPIQFKTAHDVSITHQALEHRVERLKKTAKNLEGEGYRRQARDIHADIHAITDHVLPVFRDQRELPLATEEDAERSIKSGLRTLVFRSFDGLDDTKQVERFTPASLNRRREELMIAVVGRVHTFAMEIYNRAYNAGYAARKTDAEVIITDAAKELATERIGS